MHFRYARPWSSYRKWIVSALIAFVLVGPAWARAAAYYSTGSMGQRLAGLAEREPKLIRVRELAESRGQRKVWMAEVGVGSDEDRCTRPAMLVVAGIEGNDLVGPFTAVSWIERLTEQYRAGPPMARLLRTTTVYVVPCLNPDATERFFASPKVEMSTNATPFDDDHDGLVDEDGGEDLNDDGLITMMRIEDKEGQYILDPNDNRLLLKADPLKGQTGAWRYLPEGTDNDRDERWNEDGPGGVNFNRNSPYNYGYFARDAGIHAVSEAPTRALADFVVAHPNIGMVLTYGAADNLRETPEGAPSPGRAKPMEAVDEEDTGWYEELGKLYRKTLGLDKELECISEPGTFSDWMYFHRGRLSLAARPWDVTLAREISESKEEEDDAPREKSDGEHDPSEPEEDETPTHREDKEAENEEEDNPGEEERKDLQWFDEHTPDSFVAWQAIEHPDFPGRRVEVGGYRPFVLTNPPTTMLADVAAKHGAFLTELAQRLARIRVGKIECRLLADSLYEIEIHVVNAGFLPTALAHGETTGQVHPTRVVLDLPPECFLSGERTTFLPTIGGSGGTAKVRYTIRAPDRESIRFEVVSTLAGRAKGTVELLGTSATNTNHSSQVQDSDHGVSTTK